MIAPEGSTVEPANCHFGQTPECGRSVGGICDAMRCQPRNDFAWWLSLGVLKRVLVEGTSYRSEVGHRQQAKMAHLQPLLQQGEGACSGEHQHPRHNPVGASGVRRPWGRGLVAPKNRRKSGHEMRWTSRAGAAHPGFRGGGGWRWISRAAVTWEPVSISMFHKEGHRLGGVHNSA